MTDTTPLPRRGKSRGGLGKYLRARGRRGYGRPAEFTQRLVLEDEVHDEEDEEFKAEQTQKYSKRQLASNADRYAEQEPELDSDGMSVRVWNFQLTLVTGEPIVEPEVDLSAFLEKQRLADDSVQADEDEEDDVDHNLDNFPTSTGQIASKKGKVEQIEWTQELEQLAKDKASAEANWELKSRFRAKSERLKAPFVPNRPKKTVVVEQAPELPGAAPKTEKEEMEQFLDDLIG